MPQIIAGRGVTRHKVKVKVRVTDSEISSRQQSSLIGAERKSPRGELARQVA